MKTLDISDLKANDKIVETKKEGSKLLKFIIRKTFFFSMGVLTYMIFMQ